MSFFIFIPIHPILGMIAFTYFIYLWKKYLYLFDKIDFSDSHFNSLEKFWNLINSILLFIREAFMFLKNKNILFLKTPST